MISSSSSALMVLGGSMPVGERLVLLLGDDAFDFSDAGFTILILLILFG
jgi:hypothetical protein